MEQLCVAQIADMDRTALVRRARIAIGGHDDSERALIGKTWGRGVGQFAFCHCQHQGRQIAGIAHHQHLTFGIAKAAVILDQFWTFSGQHQSGEQDAAIGHVLHRHHFDGRLDNLSHHPRFKFGGQHGGGRISAHAAGIGAGIALSNALMILGRTKGDNGTAIGKGKEAGFLAFHKFLDDNAGACIAKAPAEHVLQRSKSFVMAFGNDHTFARGQAVRLYDIGWFEVGQAGNGFCLVGIMLIGCCGDIGRAANFLGEAFGAFQLCCLCRWSEYGNVGHGQAIGQTINQGCFGANDDKADVMVGTKADDSGMIFDIQPDQNSHFCNPGVAGCCIECIATGGLRKPPGQRMLPSTRSDQQDIQMSDSPIFDDDAEGSRLLAEDGQGNNAPAFSVSEISHALKRAVEDRFGHVRVRGELSGFKRAASGHLYFGLKDADAMLDGVMWKGNAGRLAFRPEDGLEVIATGKLTTYPGRSKYQMVAERLELAGEGALMLLFEKLKARLAAEGIFDPARKRPIPYLPQTIGIVTSPTGAVIRDMLHRLADRFPSHVIVWPVLVQGDGAAAQISAAIRGFSALPEEGKVKRPDLLIVARGGGSIEDLWAFNEEAVVRAVAECSIPVISAVGHETDTTLCDFAADLRAPTPTAAAEMAVPVRLDLAERLGQAGLRLTGGVRRLLQRANERLEAQRRLMPKLADLAAPKQQRADELGERLKRGLERRADAARVALAGSATRLNPALLTRQISMRRERLAGLRLPQAALQRRLVDAKAKLDSLGRLAESFHPEAPLRRGFARVTGADGRTLTTAEAAKAAGQVNIGFADGAVDAVVVGGSVVRKPAAKPAPSGAIPQQDLFEG
jgi:exodeoxyribonuclease VII large subunit